MKKLIAAIVLCFVFVSTLSATCVSFATCTTPCISETATDVETSMDAETLTDAGCEDVNTFLEKAYDLFTSIFDFCVKIVDYVLALLCSKCVPTN